MVVSLPISSVVDTRGFKYWARQFHRGLKSGEAQRAWKQLVEAGCVAADLTWALYNAVSTAAIASGMPRERRDFDRAKNRVIQDLRALKHDFTKMTQLRFGGSPAWHVALQLWTLRQIPPVLAGLPAHLYHCERVVSRLHLITFPGWHPKKTQSTIARSAELVVSRYVDEFAGPGLSKELRLLLHHAALAYGIGKRSFDPDDIAHRENRYRREDLQSLDQKREWMREFKKTKTRTRLELFIQKKTLKAGYPIVLDMLLKKTTRPAEREDSR